MTDLVTVKNLSIFVGVRGSVVVTLLVEADCEVADDLVLLPKVVGILVFWLRVRRKTRMELKLNLSRTRRAPWRLYLHMQQNSQGHVQTYNSMTFT